ncbi:MAG TPA: tetratricopeptide repeat protein [Bryobacteraceae bacterium]|jgi:tetratricopeptide (TPR) repeat protein
MAACFPAAALAQTPEAELREGIALTSRGRFADAIPHFLTARGRVSDSFALDFNLALCYVGTRQFPAAIRVLSDIPAGPRTAEVKNLLAQAFVGDRQREAAWKAFQDAVALAPKDERLYLLVSQACLDEGFSDLARRVLDTGLRNLPDSARLHFQMGVLYAHDDENTEASREFEAAQRLGPGSEIAYIAAAEQALIAGHIDDVIRTARAGIRAGFNHYLLLTMLGEGLLRSGATPDTPAEFSEAQAALEKAVAARPGYSSSHIALGRVYLALGRAAEAVEQLESARRLDPRNKAVYPPLAAAYQRSGQAAKAKEALAALAALNREDAARIGSADGGRAGYVGKPKADKKPPQ